MPHEEGAVADERRIVDALRAERVSPLDLIEVAEDFRVLNRLEYLMVVVSQLRRREPFQTPDHLARREVVVAEDRE